MGLSLCGWGVEDYYATKANEMPEARSERKWERGERRKAGGRRAKKSTGRDARKMRSSMR
jgi:hypothetical protein